MTDHLHDFYARRAYWIAQRDSDPANLPDANQWRELRPTVHQRFMTSLGLAQPPERGDLKATVTGTFTGPGYTAKKITYQILPDCWGSAHLYRPADLPEDQPTPALLYTCGHQVAGVVGYQYQPIAWARRGYTCLIFDTIEQHDNPGDHHGLNLDETPEWIARGYAGSGGEVFNGMRALDLLLEQPGVDPKRIGVTGISGGGAQSFMLAAADERIAAVATACGVSSPDFAIPNMQVISHCGCMYPHNPYAHDISHYAALIAPRALLYCFARHDSLYTPDEFRALHARTHARFEKLGCSEQYALYEYDGPHGYNSPETTDAIHDWFDKYVAGETHPRLDTLAVRDEMLDEPTLSTFHGQTPEPNRLAHLPEMLCPTAQIRLPETPDQWPKIQQAVTDRLRREVFGLLDDVEQPQTLNVIGQWGGGSAQVNRYRGELDGLSQMIDMYAQADESDEAMVVGMAERWRVVLRVGGPLRRTVAKLNAGTLAIEPRCGGLAAFREEHRGLVNREGCLVGLTPTMMMVQDLHHLWPKLKALSQMQGKKLYLYGKGESAIAMLYHALLNPDPDVAGVVLEDLPYSFTQTTHQILGAMRVADIPQAVGLLAPTPVVLVEPTGTKNRWYWAERAHSRVSETPLTNVLNTPEAFACFEHQVAQPSLAGASQR